MKNKYYTLNETKDILKKSVRKNAQELEEDLIKLKSKWDIYV